MPSGAVRNTSSSREKLCSWIISSASMTMTITGNTTTIAAFPLAFPRSRRRSRSGRPAAGRRGSSAISARSVGDVGRLDAVDDVGAHRDRHVAVAPPQDRLLVGISILATCDSGTATPLREVMVRSPTWPRSSRSDGTARATTSIFSMPSRTWSPVAGEQRLSVCETSCGVSPSARARS